MAQGVATRLHPLPVGERVWVRGGCSRWISCSPHWHSTKRFRAPAGARVTSPLLVQRRSNQEETTPRWRALRASCPAGARAGSGVFRRDSCPDEKLARIPAGHPSDFPPPTRRAIGAPGRAARSRRALGRSRYAAAKVIVLLALLSGITKRQLCVKLTPEIKCIARRRRLD